ncbi:MAG: HAMP domain-containing sensor histidine kinase [Candidatus Nomurabacteria bacterium]|nr:HAMP domain-containing sensor histidine kinase [Candidatus Nomurabacteria bacterium]
MEKLSKQFEGWVTKWKTDSFLIARIKLTFFYFLTASVILIVASSILYRTFLFNITESVNLNVDDEDVAQVLVDRTQDILLNKFITTDSSILIVIIVCGFLLTKKSLDPIRENMKRQKRFIADASHELRTPIAIAISGLEVAMSNKNFNIDIAKKTLSNTLEEMQDLSKLTNNLLDVTKYNVSSSSVYEPLQINEVISQAVEKMKALAKAKEIEIKNEIKEQVNVLGNKTEIERIVYNIINNSLAHTPNEGIVTISDFINKKEYIISITDNGSGISKENLDKIFDPFFQGDTSRNNGGAGLGLTLAKKIIENHKGKITIKSELNKGTNVIIKLPISS